MPLKKIQSVVNNHKIPFVLSTVWNLNNRFREKLKIKILATDTSTVDLTLSESISLIKSLRNFRDPFPFNNSYSIRINYRLNPNFTTEYKIWLKIDYIFAKAIKDGDEDQYISKGDLMDVLNTFAYREVQNLESWQYLIQKFIDYMIKDEIDLKDLISAVISFKSASIKSPELYEMIVNYFTYK